MDPPTSPPSSPGFRLERELSPEPREEAPANIQRQQPKQTLQSLHVSLAAGVPAPKWPAPDLPPVGGRVDGRGCAGLPGWGRGRHCYSRQGGAPSSCRCGPGAGSMCMCVDTAPDALCYRPSASKRLCTTCMRGFGPADAPRVTKDGPLTHRGRRTRSLLRLAAHMPKAAAHYGAFRPNTADAQCRPAGSSPGARPESALIPPSVVRA